MIPIQRFNYPALAYGVHDFDLARRLQGESRSRQPVQKNTAMVKVLLPTGREIYVCEKQRVLVSLDDRGLAKRLEKAIRKRLKDDPRFLSIEVHSGEDPSCWHAKLKWGDAAEYQVYPSVFFGPGEQELDIVAGRILEELGPCRSVQRMDTERPASDSIRGVLIQDDALACQTAGMK